MVDDDFMPTSVVGRDFDAVVVETEVRVSSPRHLFRRGEQISKTFDVRSECVGDHPNGDVEFKVLQVALLENGELVLSHDWRAWRLRPRRELGQSLGEL